MRKYIDCAKFRERIDRIPPFTKGDQCHPLFNYAKGQFLMALETEPAADVSERKTGYWIRLHPHVYKCSECGDKTGNGRSNTDFCPDCGADMRGQRWAQGFADGFSAAAEEGVI